MARLAQSPERLGQVKSLVRHEGYKTLKEALLDEAGLLETALVYGPLDEPDRTNYLRGRLQATIALAHILETLVEGAEAQREHVERVDERRGQPGGLGVRHWGDPRYADEWAAAWREASS